MNVPVPPVPRPIARRGDRIGALDFFALKEEGIALAQHYSGAHWTDYNAHDPGVTILEQLCFALTELGYRAGLPIEDLLARADRCIFRRPAEMLPTEPVTEADYRRLLIDRVPELGNAWLSPSSGGAQGLCDIALYIAPDLPGRMEPWDETEAARIVTRARRVYLRHRALGEDAGSVSVLRPVRARVSGRVSIDPGARPEAVMARILYRLGVLMAPEPRRVSVEALAAEGISASDLLDGPMLANGLIAAVDLTARRRRIEAAELARHVSAVAGVLGVDELRIELGDEAAGVGAEVSENECFALDAGLDGPFPVILTAHGHVQAVDGVEVRRLLTRSWAEHRRRFRTASELGRAFEIPHGRQRELGSYQPVSAHFPAVYGVGPQGLSADASSERQSVTSQLLGYLALFDRIMVDYLDRLANLPAILGETEIDPSLFERRLAEAIPSLAPLLVDGGPDADSLLGRAAFPIGQQERLMDFLLALQGENPDRLIPRRPRPSREPEPGRNVAIKRSLLRHVVALGRRRSSGFDYAAKRSRRNVSGLEFRSRLMLGAEVEPVKRRRPRIAVVEHILLRPRGGNPPGADREMRITALVHDGDGSARDGAWRSQVAEMVRANAPAHLVVATYFLDRPGWIRFKRLHRLWRSALRNGFTEASEMLSRDLRGLIESLEEGGRE
jgi:hypothetical protein